MTPSASRESAHGLAAQGLAPRGTLHWNLVSTELVQAAIRKGEGQLADMGPFVAVTSPHTGRSPKDKFVVAEASSERDIDWGAVNQKLSSESFDTLLADEDFAKLRKQRDLFPLSMTGDELEAFVQKQVQDYKALAGEFGLVK